MADRGYRGRPSKSERADRQINAGHSRALDAALARTEASIRKSSNEQVFVFDKNGKILSSNIGSEDSVNTTKGGRKIVKYPDSIITHNHPSSMTAKSKALQRAGSPFSGNDITYAIFNNAKEVRAVAGNFTYSLKRKGDNWNVKSTLPTELVKMTKKIDSLMRKTSKRYKDRAWNRANFRKDMLYKTSGEYRQVNKERSDVLAAHRTLKYLAKKYGWDYTRKRTI